jgi:MFS transporter, DHA3 family, macrolide efflux protein
MPPDATTRRAIALVTAARLISRLGGSAAFFVGIWGAAAYTFHADARSLAILMAGNSIAGILGAVIAGVFIDRVGPRKVLVVAEALTVPAVIALFFAHTYPAFVAAAWVFGLVASPTFTASAAFTPFLVSGPKELERVNSRVEAAGSVGWVVGPAVGAVAARIGGPSAVFLVMAVTSTVAAIIAYAIPLADQHSAEKHAPMRELRDGLRVSYTVRPVRYTILVTTLVWFGFGAFSALEPLFYRDVVHVGVEWIGWMNTVFSLGLVAGAWALPKLPGKVVSMRGLAVFGALCGFGALAYVGTSMLPVIALGAIAWGAVIGASEPLMRTLLQATSPEGFVGRVVSTSQYHRSAGELVPLAIAPGLAAVFGVQPVLIAGGVVVGFVLLMTLPAAASIDRELAAQGTVAPEPMHVEPTAGLGDEIL